MAGYPVFFTRCYMPVTTLQYTRYSAMLSIPLSAHAFVAAPATTLTRDAASPRMTAHWMDPLKFDGTTPAFDVVE